MPTIDEKLDAALAELKGLRADVAKLLATADRNLKGTALLANHLGAAPRQASGSSSSSSASGRVITDAELDSPLNNPEVKKDPPRWKKANLDSEAGRRMSECSPDFLDAVAEFRDFCADNPQAGKERYAGNDRREAQLARAWAARKRAGWRAPGEEPPPQDDPPPPDEL